MHTETMMEDTMNELQPEQPVLDKVSNQQKTEEIYS